VAWVRVDERFSSGPKVKRASLRLGGKFPRRRILSAWLDLMSYCNTHRTDGFIPDYEVAGLEDERPEAIIAALAFGDETLGPIVERDDARGGWVIRNYLKYQPSKASVEDRAEIERKRKADYRASKSRPHFVPRDVPPLSQECPTGTNRDVPYVSQACPAPTEPDRTEPDRTEPLKSVSARPLVSRRHPAHGWCNDRGLCVPQQQFDEFLGRLGGREHVPKLLAWLGSVIDTLGPTVPGENVFKFWGARFEQWQGSTAPQNTKGARTVAAGNRLQAALDAGAEIDPFGTKAHARKLAELTQKASA